MAWLVNDSVRPDIALEHWGLLDSSGDYVSPWIESAQCRSTIRIACTMPTTGTYTTTLEEGLYHSDVDFPQIVRTQSVPLSGRYGYAELDVTARYFRFVVAGSSEQVFWVTVRYV